MDVGESGVVEERRRARVGHAAVDESEIAGTDQRSSDQLCGALLEYSLKEPFPRDGFFLPALACSSCDLAGPHDPSRIYVTAKEVELEEASPSDLVRGCRVEMLANEKDVEKGRRWEEGEQMKEWVRRQVEERAAPGGRGSERANRSTVEWLALTMNVPPLSSLPLRPRHLPRSRR